jgi:hypothetical protein
MGPNHSRLGVCALAVMTCFFIAGAHAAYAASQARVHAAGQYFHTDTNNPMGGNSDRVSFGLEGKCPAPDTQCTSNGNFEYHNTFNHFHAHGKVTSLSVNSQPSPGCQAFMAHLGVPVTGKPSAMASGNCNNGSCTTFQIEVIDGDDSAPNQGDWVCGITITNGTDSTGSPVMSPESDSPQQLIRGDVEVRTTSQH